MPQTPQKCPRCQRPLPPAENGMPSICRVCLFDTAMSAEDKSESHPPFAPFSLDAEQTNFGHFTLEAELGRGGMGVVYRAREYASDRIVALKMMHLFHLQTPEMLRRFESEVRAVATLDHPNIMPVYEVGQYDGIPFFSMKFAERGSLAGKSARTAQSPRAAAALMVKLARAVFHAHQRGVIHRDLKPGNILLDASDEPYIADFGIAKITDEHGVATGATIVRGTPGYLAPELAGNAHGEITTAVDVYGLGAILYELLTSRPPATGATSAEIIRQIAKGPPAAPHILNAAIPRDLSAVCMKCLSTHAADRYASADDLAGDLENWLANRPVSACPPGVLGSAWRWCRRQPLAAGLAAGIALLLIVTGVVSTAAAIHIAVQRDRAIHAERAAQDELYKSLLTQSRLGRRTHNAGHRFDGLESLRQAARIRVTPELRNEAAALLALTDLRAVRTVAVRPEQGHSLVFDPDLERYFTTTASRELSLRRVSDNEELARFPGTGHSILGIAAFSADGRYTASRHFNGFIRIWDTREQRLAFELSNRVPRSRPYMSTRFWFGCAFSNDGKTAAIELSEGGFSIHDISNGGAETARFPGPTGALALAFAPGDTRIAVANRGKNIAEIRDTRTGEILHTFAHAGNIVALEWSPDGALLAIACMDTTIYLWNTATGTLHRQLAGHRLYAVQVTFSPGGNLLASTSADSTIILWDPDAGTRLVTLAGHGYEPMLRFSRDGKRLVTGDFKPDATIFEIQTGDDICRAFSPPGQGNVAVVTASMDFSPDSRWLATSTRETIHIWDLAHNRLAAHINPGPQTETSALFTPRGDTLLVASRNTGLAAYPFDTRAAPGKNPLGPPAMLTREQGFTLSDFGASQTHALLTNRRIGEALLWPLDPAGQPRKFPVQKEAWDAALSPDGKILATSCAAQGDLPDPRLVHLWDARTGEKLLVLNGGAGGLVRFSPDGSRLLASSPNLGFELWDTRDWQSAGDTPVNDTLFTFSLSRDGRYLCAPAQGEVWLYQGNNYSEPVIELSPPSNASLSPRSIFSHDGTLLAIHESDGIVHLWNLRNLRARLAEMSLDWKEP